MSTFLYNGARSAFASGSLDWATSNIHALLVSNAYGPSPGDTYLSAIPEGARIADVEFSSVSQSNGVCKGVIPQIDALISSATVIALVLYVSTGNDSTSLLVYYSADGAGFPFVPQGFNYAIGYDQTNGGFFQV